MTKYIHSLLADKRFARHRPKKHDIKAKRHTFELTTKRRSIMLARQV
ncbi:MAG: hypothetical protein HRT88_18980 [Lentisphaeraceae bacterium]|nr:hypothetical protein [Lentisphaeraceae bacterium]